MAANPTSESELQLYRVLQRANLLQYFDTFISQGGDDVQQLCEAGEEEFLEIMALVGMASKPLHVRRLQKVLQEWVTNPTVFQQPLGLLSPPPIFAPGSILASVQRPYLKLPQPAHVSMATPLPMWTPDPGLNNLSVLPPVIVARSGSPGSVSGGEGVYSDSLMNVSGVGAGGQMITTYMMDSPESGANSLNLDEQGSPGSYSQSTLTEAQIVEIERAAEEVARTLPHYEPKPLSMKKFISKEIEELMKLPEDHPERMDLLRKYAAIYGRFDSKRKNEKQLTLHEISVNEASAQLCKHRPTLLTRRDDLFPLARQVVRNSGYQYSKGHSRAQTVEIPPNKKQRLDPYKLPDDERLRNVYKSDYCVAAPTLTDSPHEKQKRDMRMAEINHELSELSLQQQNLKRQLTQSNSTGAPSGAIMAELDALTTQQLLLLTEQSDLLRKQRSYKRAQFRRALAGETGVKQEVDDSSNFAESLSTHNIMDSLAPKGQRGPFGKSPKGGKPIKEEPGGQITNETMVLEEVSTTTTDKPLGQDFIERSMLEEGIRIAQQYGMTDFSSELSGMKLKVTKHSKSNNQDSSPDQTSPDSSPEKNEQNPKSQIPTSSMNHQKWSKSQNSTPQEADDRGQGQISFVNDPQVATPDTGGAS